MEKSRVHVVDTIVVEGNKRNNYIEFQITNNNVMKVNHNCIKEILKYYKEIVHQIHKRIIDIKKLAEETNEELIEIASYERNTIEDREKYKDLTDVYLNYQHLVEEKEQDLVEEMQSLVILVKGVNRLYFCFQNLKGNAYSI